MTILKNEVNELFKAIELELQRAKKLFEVEVSKENSKFRFSKRGE